MPKSYPIVTRFPVYCPWCGNKNLISVNDNRYRFGFCNRECRRFYLDKVHEKEKTTRLCAVCRTPFSTNRPNKKFCSMKCVGLANRNNPRMKPTPTPEERGRTRWFIKQYDKEMNKEGLVPPQSHMPPNIPIVEDIPESRVK